MTLADIKLTNEMISAGAHQLTGLCGGTCCHKTGGYGRDDGKPCECRDTFVAAFRSAMEAAE